MIYKIFLWSFWSLFVGCYIAGWYCIFTHPFSEKVNDGVSFATFMTTFFFLPDLAIKFFVEYRIVCSFKIVKR